MTDAAGPSAHTVWCASRSAHDVPIGDGWLGPRERESLAAGRQSEQRRADRRLGRWTAKRLLLDAPGAPTWPGDATALEILNDDAGAPRIERNGVPLDASISLSHRAGRALCVVASSRFGLGCDLEVVEPRSAAFVADYFTTAERRLVERAHDADRPRIANLLWSAKESALKALGVGLRRDTRSVDVQVPQACIGDWSALTVRPADTERPLHGWWRCDAGFVLTIVADRPIHAPSGPPAHTTPNVALVAALG